MIGFWKYNYLSDASLVPLAMILVTIGMTAFEAAQLPLLERSVCRTHYSSHDWSPPLTSEAIPEHLCKIDIIQSVVAQLAGWLQFFTTIQTLFMAIPYAWLATRVDRKNLLIVSCVSTVLSMSYFLAVCYFYNIFSIKMIWLTHLFDVVGGGIAIAYILLYSLLTEATLPSSRASTFFIMSAILLCTRFIILGVSGIILERVPPFIGPLAVTAYSLTIPVLCLSLVDTRSRDVAPILSQSTLGCDTPEEDQILGVTGLLNEESTGLLDELEGEGEGDSASVVKSKFISHWKILRKDGQAFMMLTYHEFFCVRDFKLYFGMSFTSILGLNVQSIQQQWQSINLGWTLAQTTYLNAYATFFCTIVLLCLPVLSRYLIGRLGSAKRMEVTLFRISIVSRAIGALCLGFSSEKYTYLASTVLYTFGSGANDSLKALTTRGTTKKHVAHLLTVVAMVESVATIVSSHLYPRLLTIVIQSRGLQGVPYWVSGSSTLLAFFLTYSLESSGR